MNISWQSVLVGFAVLSLAGLVWFALSACQVAAKADEDFDRYRKTWGAKK